MICWWMRGANRVSDVNPLGFRMLFALYFRNYLFKVWIAKVIILTVLKNILLNICIFLFEIYFLYIPFVIQLYIHFDGPVALQQSTQQKESYQVFFYIICIHVYKELNFPLDFFLRSLKNLWTVFSLGKRQTF